MTDQRRVPRRRPVLVVGVDGTDTSWRALHYALGLARLQQASLVVVVGHTIATASWLPGAGALGTEPNAEFRDKIREMIAKLATEAGDIPAEIVHGAGDPVVLLAKVAKKYQADAIIIGASESWWHRYFGSVGQRAVRLRHWPVTVVP